MKPLILSSRTLAASAALLAALTGNARAENEGQRRNFIGMGVGAIPVYEGSSEYRALPVPLIQYQSGHFFISPRAGLPAMGLKFDLAPDWTTGAFVGMGLGRKADDADLTKGLEDIDFHGTYGAFIEWSPGDFSVIAAYRQAAKSGYGATLDLRATYTAWRDTRNRVSIGANTQWADSDYMQTWFGVTPSQAARSRAGLDTYSASSGFKSVSVFGTWTHNFNDRWAAVTTLGVSTLAGDARDSPLTDRETNAFAHVGVIYAF